MRISTMDRNIYSFHPLLDKIYNTLYIKVGIIASKLAYAGQKIHLNAFIHTPFIKYSSDKA